MTFPETPPFGLLCPLCNFCIHICSSIKKDLDGKLNYLLSANVEGSLNVVTLLLTGRATPYLHNGVVYVGDEDHYVCTVYLFAELLTRRPTYRGL